jgi:hypothetical protein
MKLMRWFLRRLVGMGLFLWATALVWSAENVMLTGVPDYSWYAGCFGTAGGNLMGYWDRHGFPNLYTGPTAGGVAPLDSDGSNHGIRSMWASKAGFDGRPAGEFGHIDDYWSYYFDDFANSYESTSLDAYVTAGRPEHSPDCICDFIGASQNKWKNLNGECDGNVDAYAVTFWDTNGTRRVNYVPPPEGDVPVRDIPSGFKAWTQFRGYQSEVFSQLADFNPNVPAGRGFTFEDLKAEIDTGYPVMLFLQRYDEPARFLPGMPNANPDVHGMLAYGYYITDIGAKFVRYKTSWGGSGDNSLKRWNSDLWEAILPLRGVIGYHPTPQITSISRTNDALAFQWHGPSSTLSNLVARTGTKLHQYVVEKSVSLEPGSFVAVSEPTPNLETVVTNCCADAAFFRVRLVPP